MIEEQLKAREIRDARVLAAMARVPRHLFVPEDLRRYAYDDGPLPIGQGQTISQPYVVAYMTDTLQLRPDDTVLEIGRGRESRPRCSGKPQSRAIRSRSFQILPHARGRRSRRRAIAMSKFAPAMATAGWPAAAPFPRTSLP